jgi:hypothetical protein
LEFELKGIGRDPPSAIFVVLRGDGRQAIGLIGRDAFFGLQIGRQVGQRLLGFFDVGQSSWSQVSECFG